MSKNNSGRQNAKDFGGMISAFKVAPSRQSKPKTPKLSATPSSQSATPTPNPPAPPQRPSAPSTPPAPYPPSFSTSRLPSSRPPSSYDVAQVDPLKDTLLEESIFRTLVRPKQQPDASLVKFVQKKAAELEGVPLIIDARISPARLAALIFMCGNFEQPLERELVRMKEENAEKYESFLLSVENKEIFAPTTSSAGVDYVDRSLNVDRLSRLTYACHVFMDNVILYHSIPKYATYHRFRSNIVREMFHMGWRLVSSLVQGVCNEALAYAPTSFKFYQQSLSELTPEKQRARNNNLTRTATELHNQLMTLFEMMSMGLCESLFLNSPGVAIYVVTNSAGEQIELTGWQYFVTDPLSVIHTQCKVVMLQHAKLFGLFFPLEDEYVFRPRNVASRVVSFMNYVKNHVIDPIMLAHLLPDAIESVLSSSSSSSSSSLSSSSSSTYDDDEPASNPLLTPTRPYATFAEKYPSPDTVKEDESHSFAVAMYNATNKLRDILWALVDDISALQRHHSRTRSRRPKTSSGVSTRPTVDETQEDNDGDTTTNTTSVEGVADVLLPSSPAIFTAPTTTSASQLNEVDSTAVNNNQLFTQPIAFSPSINESQLSYTPYLDDNDDALFLHRA